MLEFGWPTDLVAIHFPSNYLNPIYWYWPTQQPTNWLFLGQKKFIPPGVTYAPGYAFYNIGYYPVIKILPFDTQPVLPYPNYGAASLVDALGGRHEKTTGTIISSGQTLKTNSASGSLVGKFDFTSKLFWELVKQKPPLSKNGTILNPYTQATSKPLQKYYIDAVETFLAMFNEMATGFNKLTQSGGAFTNNNWSSLVPFALALSSFGLKPPPVNVTGPGGWQDLARNTIGAGGTDAWYYGAIDPGYWFNFLQIEAVGYASTLAIGQLDPTEWDQTVFPPRQYQTGQKSKKHGYGGKSPQPFPYGPPPDTAFSQM